MNSQKRILILDDNEDILKSVYDILEYANFQVKTTPDIFTFFKLVDEWQPHLVIIDYILQGINGGDICHQIKTGDATRGIPVIMMSGYPAVLNSLGNYGYDDLLVKPFSVDNLLLLVEKHLQRSKVA